MAYALDPAEMPTFQPDLFRAQERATQVHDLIARRLEDKILSVGGADAGRILSAALEDLPEYGVTFVVTSSCQLVQQRAVLRVAFPFLSAAPPIVSETYLPMCLACFGLGYQTPLRTAPLLKQSHVADDGRVVWKDYSQQERRVALRCITGGRLDELVPVPIRKAFDAVIEKLDELRGTGEMDEVVGPLGEASKELGAYDDFGLRISAHISRGSRLAAVATLWHLTPYGRKIDCGEGPKLYASDWDFVRARGGRPRTADIDYFVPCWWCRGNGVIERRFWRSFAHCVLVVKLLLSLLRRRIFRPANSEGAVPS